MESSTELPPLTNAKTVPPQVAPPGHIRSIELFRNSPGGVPVITLNSNEQITLRFDELADASNTFTIRVRHFNADWTESSLISGQVNRGFQDDVIGGGTAGVGQFPSFYSYSYTFPNRELGIRVSGNFMIEVADYASRELLFSLPFFVMEDRGRLDASVSEFFQGRNFPYHQIFAEYYFPNFVNLPLTDIDIYFVQNQFWGRSKRASQRDVSSPDYIRLHNDRNEGFPGRYEFRPLHIDDIYSISRDVIEVSPDRDPPLIRLQYDVVDLDINPRPSRSYAFGAPRTGRNARYTEVEFNLDRPSFLEQDEEVYVMGSFTNWNFTDSQKMVYSETDDAFSTRILMKEGRYDYIYAVRTRSGIDDLRLAAFFAQTVQDYQILVYFRDQQENYDRLLQYGSLRSR
ncbi:MAG: DUF5103 domain-containing protein [Balneolia bacterium]|nr:DUF5103 domain-containing protein [Balneolia bacterium]